MAPFTQAILLAAFGGFCIGVGLTWLLTRNKARSADELNSVRQEMQQYRQKVEQHFVETADAVDELNRSYQKVFAHLSQGAEQLMDKESYRREAEKRKGQAITLAYLSREDEAAAETAVAPERPVPADAPELPQNNLDGINAASNASPVIPKDVETPADASAENLQVADEAHARQDGGKS